MGRKGPIAHQIAHTAARQFGNVKRVQLLELGLSADAINRWVKAGRLYRVHRGVYSVGRPPVTPLERAMASVLACGARAVLSHGSALSLWGIWKRWDTPFHVTIAGDRRLKGIRIHRVRCLDRREITRQQGIPVTTLARAVLDCAPSMRPRSLNRAINDGRLAHHLPVEALLDVVAGHPSHPGSRLIKAALGVSAADRPTRSQFEDGFPAYCERFGLPIPRMNTIVCGHEVDALFEPEKVIVELDGWSFHSSRASFESDRSRDADTLAAGFVTVRITGDRYRREPRKLAERLHEILASRRT